MEDIGLFHNDKTMYIASDQVCGGSESRDEYSRPGGEKVVVHRTWRKEIIVAGTPLKSIGIRQPLLPAQSDLVEVKTEVENQGIFHTVTIPRYLNLEPSLAMDWLEISWDELHIKERIGAGTPCLEFQKIFVGLLNYYFVGNNCIGCEILSVPISGSFGTVHRAEWHGSVSIFFLLIHH